MRRTILLVLLVGTMLTATARAETVAWSNAKNETLEKASPTGTAVASATADAATGAMSAQASASEVFPEPILLGRSYASAVATLQATREVAGGEPVTVTWSVDGLAAALSHQKDLPHPLAPGGAAPGVFLNLVVDVCSATQCHGGDMDGTIVSSSQPAESRIFSVTLQVPEGAWTLHIRATGTAAVFAGGMSRGSASLSIASSTLEIA